MSNGVLFKATRAAISSSNPLCSIPARGRSMEPLHLHDTPKIPQLARTATRILVIDDDACVNTAIRAILARHRCETVLALRAHAGIRAFLTFEFDVVIVDLFMPGMNGLDTIKRIRGESAVPIIAMSGFRLRNSLNADQDFFEI